MERKAVNTFLNHEVDCAASFKTIFGNRGVSSLKKFVLAFSMIFLLSVQGFSQAKYEREFRIRARDVPSTALSFVDSMNFNSRIRWFKEIGLDQVSIEAKTRFKRERYSIEFSEDGIFQDVEIEIKPNKIPPGTFTEITRILSQRYKRYKIVKVQIQYTGHRNLVLKFLRENRSNPEGITINYEVVISTRMDGSFLMLEYLFSETGEYVQSNQIISKRKDTLDY